MNEQERRDYIRYRIESAYKAYKDAGLLADNSSYNAAVNRLYYAIYYAVSALLLENGIHTKTHSTIKSQFSQNFVKTGRLDRKYSRLLAELYDGRQRGDYADTFDFDEASVRPLFDRTKEMIERIESEIKTENT